MRTTWIILRSSLVFLLLSLPAPAQTASTGALTGQVNDPNGAVVPAVQVRVTNEATGEQREVVSQENGSYVVPLLLPGSYRVEFSKTGFKSATKSGLQINVTETARLDVQLELGSVQEHVTVTAEAELLQTESSALGRVTDRELVNNLPLVTRNYTQIVTLSPGIAANVTNATELGRGNGGVSQGNFRAHGASGADNNFQMNGVQVNDLQASSTVSGGVAIPNPDAIQEFKVQTGLYDATYRRNAGANVNVVTRSGGNEFHGNVFEYFRNDALNANEFFRNAAGRAIWPVVGDDGRATAFGNSGVGIVFGPDQRNFDIVLIKRTPVGWLREGANIEFRTELFNAFNTTQFSSPGTNVSAATFGVISSTSVNLRIIQFALKPNF